MIVSSHSKSNNSPYFMATSRIQQQASKIYKQLPQDFFEITQKQGINKGTIVESIKRMLLSPKFEKLSIETMTHELLERLNLLIEAVKAGKPKEELQKLFKLPEQALGGLLIKQDRIKRAQEATKLFKAGMSIQKIAETTNLGERTIRKYLAIYGINFGAKPISREEIKSLVERGLSDIEIAEAIGAHPNSIWHVRKELNLKSNRHKGKVQAQAEEIIKELESGATRKEVAKKHNICKGMVDKLAEKHNIYRKNKAKRDAEVIEKLLAEIPVKAVASECGISHATVLRIARKNNIPLLKDYTERNIAIIEALKTKKIIDVAKEFNLSEQRVWTIKETFKG